VGALAALDESGVRVPDDVAVVGIDDIQESAYTHPPLTSIAPDLDVIAERALSLLAEQEGAAGVAPREEATPYRLVVRASSLRARPGSPT